MPRILALAAALLASTALANDAAAALAAGGIELRTERRVTMVRERLTIGIDEVSVDYDFRNDSAEDVTTEVAFPVPALGYQGENSFPTSRLDDFRAWVDGKPLQVEKDVRAKVGDRDVTELLLKLGVSAQDFGGFDHEDDGAAFKARLGAERYGALLREGLLDKDEPVWPSWEVAVTYHWRQTFPAGKVVHVRHAYTPARGYELARASLVAQEHPDGCFTPDVIRGLIRRVEAQQRKKPHSGDYVGLSWVNYILTTANTWRTPIHDFELVIERRPGTQVSLCWEGKVVREGRTRLRATEKDFVPTRELTVYFY